MHAHTSVLNTVWVECSPGCYATGAEQFTEEIWAGGSAWRFMLTHYTFLFLLLLFFSSVLICLAAVVFVCVAEQLAGSGRARLA